MRIKTADLTKTYRIGPSQIAAVNRVSLEVDEATFVAIVGPSGSGKSTLLNLIGLNDTPTQGKVLIDDADASLLSASERRRIRLMRMGFVFQTFNLMPTLSALENVELPMALAGASQKAQRERSAKLLETVGLTGRVRHRPKELSMGEMQRVSLLFEANREEKTTVIVATHDEKVVSVANKTYIIKDGNLETEK
jgi:ABC-type lipoprotein export system ATPase subunit